VPTTYPKCSPSEMIGLLLLLNAHKGSEDIALLADDLDLEIDEILPATDFAQALQLIKVVDGRATLTDLGKKLVAGSIRDRKPVLREQLKKTTLFKALLRALEGAPEKRLSEEDVNRLIAFTNAPADEYVQNIINWGRYTELFRYDSDQRLLLPSRAHAPLKGAPPSPPASGGGTSPSGSTKRGSGAQVELAPSEKLASLVGAAS
jgi:NitT/TauT family transport system ATP-binding protein